MANIRIKDLTGELAQMGDNDYLAVEDGASGETKKIKKSAILAGLPEATTSTKGLMRNTIYNRHAQLSRSAQYKTPVWIKSDKTMLADDYQLSGLEAILDMWFEFPAGKPAIWDLAEWDVFVGYMSKASPTNGGLFVYIADQTGTTADGHFYAFYITVTNTTSVQEITSTITISSKSVVLKAIIDYRNLLVPASGVAFNLGASLAGRKLIIQKRESSAYINKWLNPAVLKGLADVSGRLQYNGSPIAKLSDLAAWRITSGANIVKTLPTWTEWGFYKPTGALDTQNLGWIYTADYIPVYAGVSQTIIADINDNAPLILYNKNKEFVRSIGSGTGTTVVHSLTFTPNSDECFIRCSNHSAVTANFAVTVNSDVDVVTRDTTQLKADVAAIQTVIPEKSSISTISPTKVYTTCNDVSSSWTESKRGYAAQLYLDRFVILTKKRDIKFKETGTLEKTLASRIYLDPTVDPAVVEYNHGEDVHEEDITLTIAGEDTTDTQIRLKHVSAKSSLSQDLYPKILQIGDSVTEGAEAGVNGDADKPEQSWQWVKYFFELDRIESGNNTSKYNCLSIGTRKKRDYTAVLNGTTNNIRACCEGRSGWTVRDYLYSKTDTSAPVSNPFYDGAKAGTVKFSLAKYLERYKTLAEDGKTRLMQGSTTGTLVTDVNAFDVCTPNIVVIQLGFNDVTANYVGDLQLMINAIKAEYPNMIIGLSIVGPSGTYFAWRYPEWEGSESDISLLTQPYCKGVHEKMCQVFDAVKAMENATNKIFVVPCSFVQPTAMSMGHRIQAEASYLSDTMQRFVKYQPFATSAIGYHPNNYAHAAWGYQVYSWIKWLGAMGYLS